ncbi:hypothetical protein EYF80_054489 [Liparis tanakae]|uniref:Uncharacterized protein n=1 Tax=Liparis tanakae TaxID=230148 RepID=A0A4Z2F3T4_9TELE|nr:hypothetical protein EYF80_054489 [Liparis tanakae]
MKLLDSDLFIKWLTHRHCPEGRGPKTWRGQRPSGRVQRDEDQRPGGDNVPQDVSRGTRTKDLEGTTSLRRADEHMLRAVMILVNVPETQPRHDLRSGSGGAALMEPLHHSEDTQPPLILRPDGVASQSQL